jgi:3-oxoacyl-ACP reductase-like protein
LNGGHRSTTTFPGCGLDSSCQEIDKFFKALLAGLEVVDAAAPSGASASAPSATTTATEASTTSSPATTTFTTTTTTEIEVGRIVVVGDLYE